MIVESDSRVARQVLTFWFGPSDAPAAGQPRVAWFRPDPAFDADIRARFLTDYALAAAGAYDSLADTPLGALALVVLLDQFPRNMFRRSPRAFAADATARAVAAGALERGFDTALSREQRLFLYLPFEHSESLADQDRSVALMAALGDTEWTRYAERHREIIQRFGRFPHRNAVLGRSSTPDELAFLTEPDSAF